MKDKKEVIRKLASMCVHEGKFDQGMFQTILEYVNEKYPFLLNSFRKEIEKIIKKGTITITSSYDLSNDEKNAIIKKFEADFFDFKTDKNILGGLIVKNKDTVLDNSLLTKINQLK
jgi:F0F1-type ATP synthase delta subunit